MNDTDVAINTLYQKALFDSPAEFRSGGLRLLAEYAGAESAAWVTHNERGVIGEFTVLPASLSASPQALVRLEIPDESKIFRLPTNGNKRLGHAVRHTHLTAELTSTVAMWFAGSSKPPPSDDLCRIVGHMAEAAALALRNFILRDERLADMGRPSRGATALIDASGVIYACSGRFRELLQDEFRVDSLAQLPFTIPDDALSGDGLFSQGNLRFRSSRLGSLYMMHARQPQPLDSLSPREQQIARALGRGKTFKSVARQCGIAVSTVANHASRIYRKLGIYRREDLVEMVRTSRIADRPGSSAN